MNSMWVLIANSSSAHIFDVKDMGKSINKMDSRLYPEGRAHEGDINTDKQGSAHSSVGSAGHKMSSSVSMRSHQNQRWATELAIFLSKKLSQGAFTSLSVAAPAQLMGEIRNAFDKNKALAKVVVQEEVKDYPESLSESQMVAGFCKSFDLHQHESYKKVK